MLPVLSFGWLTYQDPRGDSLPAFGRVWDRFPRFRPDMIDDRDPPQQRADRVEDGMVDLAEHVKAGTRPETAIYKFGRGRRRDRPELMRVTVTASCEYARTERVKAPDGDALEVYPQFPAAITGSIDPRLFTEQGAWEEFYELFKTVAVQVEAYFAFITPLELQDQFRGVTLPYLELRDVEWINWYGPSLLDFWGGPERLAGVGVHRATVGDALIVWASDDPPAPERSATRRSHYRWKQPFYGALGRRTFFLPDPHKRLRSFAEQWEACGVNLPSPEQQRRYARQHPDGPS